MLHKIVNSVTSLLLYDKIKSKKKTTRRRNRQLGDQQEGEDGWREVEKITRRARANR